MNVVVTRERGRNERLRQWLPDGCEVTEVPVTTTVYDDEGAVLERVRASGHWGEFATIVVTSARSARYAGAVRAALLADAESFSVGAATTEALAGVGLHVAAQSVGGAIDLARQIDRAPVLVLGAATMRDELTSDLRSRGLDVTVVACYETRRLTLGDEERSALSRADVVVVGAPSAWTVLKDAVDPSTWVVVPGATTGEIVRATHPRVLEGWGPSLRDRLLDVVNGTRR